MNMNEPTIETCTLEPFYIEIDKAGLAPLMATGTPGRISIWGVSPIAPLHLGYDELIVTQRRLIRDGFRHRVLIADLHSIMTHDLKPSDAQARSQYYEGYLRAAAGLEADYVRGSDFQVRHDYVEALLSILCKIPLSRLKKHIPSRVVRGISSGHAVASVYTYAVMQCLDALYLEANLIFADESQRKVYTLLDELTPSDIERSAFRSYSLRPLRRNVHGPIHAWYIPTGADILGRPLSESTAATRISIHETQDSLRTKIGRMYAPPLGQAAHPGKRNALFYTFQYSVFPWRETAVEVYTMSGRVLQLRNWCDFARAWESGELHPQDCKEALQHCLWERLIEIRERLGFALSAWVDPAEAIGVL